MAPRCVEQSALGLSRELEIRAVELVGDARRLKAYLAQQECMMKAYQGKGVTKGMASEQLTASSNND